MRFFIGFLIFSLWALGTRYFYVCHVKCLCETSKPASIDTLSNKASTRAQTLVLMSGSESALSGYEQFLFDNSSHEPVLNEDNKRFLKDMVEYLNANPGMKVKIIGRYLESEQKPTSGFYENLGTARAAAIRDILVNEYKLNPATILTDFESAGVGENAKSGPDVPVIFTVPGGQSAVAGMAEAHYEFANMTFSDANFASGSATLTPKPQFVTYADSVKSYLSRTPHKYLRIIGHTDTDGDDKKNMKLGLDRSKAGKKYFEKLGVKVEIQTDSKGEIEPVVPNDSPENKAKNRRINILILDEQ